MHRNNRELIFFLQGNMPCSVMPVTLLTDIKPHINIFDGHILKQISGSVVKFYLHALIMMMNKKYKFKLFMHTF